MAEGNENNRKGARQVVPTVAVCLAVAAGGIGFTAASMADTAFDPTSYLAQNLRDKASDQISASYDLTNTETDAEANRQDDGSEDRGQTAQDVQVDERSGSSVYEATNGDADTTVVSPGNGDGNGDDADEGASADTITIPTGPVVDTGTTADPADDNGDSDSEEPTGPDEPAWTDPDPDSGYQKNDGIYSGTIDYNSINGDTDISDVSSSDTWELVVLSAPEDAEALWEIDPIYNGEYLTSKKLICSLDVYVMRNGDYNDMYRLTDFGENFKIVSPELPSFVGSSLEVELAFRPTADSEWVSTSTTLIVQPYKIAVRGYDDEEGNATTIATLYPAEGSSADLSEYYSQMLTDDAVVEDSSLVSWLTFNRVVKWFEGWSTTEDGQSVGTSFTPTENGYIELYPLGMVDIPEEYYIVQHDDWGTISYELVSWDPSKSEDATTLVVPDMVDTVYFGYMAYADGEDATTYAQVERMVIPASVTSISGLYDTVWGTDEPYGVNVTDEFVVEEGNANYFARDGVLYSVDEYAGAVTLEYIPTAKTDITVDADVTSINFWNNTNCSVQTITFTGEEPISIDASDWEALSNVTIKVPAAHYFDYLLAWNDALSEANEYGANLTLVPDDGSSSDYAVADGTITNGSGTELVRIDEESYDWYLIDGDISAIKAGTMDFAHSSSLILPEGVSVIEAGSLFGSGTLDSLYCLGTTPPAIDAAALDDAPDGFTVYVSADAYESYLAEWSKTLGADKAKEILQVKTFEVKDVSGNTVFYDYADDGTAEQVVLLKANPELTDFTADTIEGLTAVGTKAFADCSWLQFVTLPATCTTVGSHAFDGTPIQMFASLATDELSIRPDALTNCSELNFAVFRSGSATFDECSTTNVIATTCWGYAEAGCAGFNDSDFDYYSFYDFELQQVDGGYVLYGTYSATGQRYLVCSTQGVTGEIDMPDDVTGIYAYAFSPYWHDYTGTVTFNEEDWARLTDINAYAFIDSYGWYSSTLGGQVTLPEGLTAVNAYAFTNCAGITEINGCAGIQYIDDGAFMGCTNLTSVDLTEMEGLWCIGSGAFSGCTSLESVDASGLEGIMVIGDSVFANCSSLKTFTAEGASSFYAITDSMFYECTSLEELDLSGMTGLSLVESNAFYGCTALTSIILPESLTELGPSPFGGCASLQQLTFTSESAPLLILYSEGFEYSFGDDLPDSFHIVLAGSATGQEQAYIDTWKYYLLGLSTEDELTEEQDLAGTNAVRALLGLEPLESLAEDTEAETELGESTDTEADVATMSAADAQVASTPAEAAAADAVEAENRDDAEDIDADAADAIATLDDATGTAAESTGESESDESKADIAGESPDGNASDGNVDTLAAEESSE